jgi:hypothetical protein
MVSNQICTINNFMVGLKCPQFPLARRLREHQSVHVQKKNKNPFLCQELKPGTKLDYYTTKLLTSDTK